MVKSRPRCCRGHERPWRLSVLRAASCKVRTPASPEPGLGRPPHQHGRPARAATTPGSEVLCLVWTFRPIYSRSQAALIKCLYQNIRVPWKITAMG